MARTRSERVGEIKSRVRERLQGGGLRPGSRFLSTRAFATKYGVSYQTAHRVISELAEEGLLERRAASGTYVPGRCRYEGVVLLFATRAQRPDSFGACLLNGLTQRLNRENIAWQLRWSDNAPFDFEYSKLFPVVWDAPVPQNHSALLLNDRPAPGLGAAHIDSVSLDDFSGGVCAGELMCAALNAEQNGEQNARKNAEQDSHLSTLRRRDKNSPRWAILSGPSGDRRSLERLGGFLHVVPHAQVVTPRGWFLEDGLKVAEQVVRLGRDGIFCCNDRLAQAVCLWCEKQGEKRPRLIGFDDAPIAEKLDLTTIAIPWDEMIEGATQIIKRRLEGDNSAAHHLTISPRPVVRKL